MLNSLRSHYGKHLVTYRGHDWYQFPTVNRLAQIREQHLRQLGFGYRAKFIVHTAQQVVKNEGFLCCLLYPSYSLF